VSTIKIPNEIGYSMVMVQHMRRAFCKVLCWHMNTETLQYVVCLLHTFVCAAAVSVLMLCTNNVYACAND
jgi:hypothetical protein